MPSYQFWLIITASVIQMIILYWGGYFTKRGQNKADEETLEKLTQIVESVKQSFISENSRLIAEIDSLKDRRNKNFSQAQQAIITFYHDFNNWVELMTSLDPYVYNTDNIIKINQQLIEIKNFEAKVKVSNSLMDLLVQDSDSTRAGHNLIVRGVEVQAYVNIRIVDICNKLITLRNDRDLLKNPAKTMNNDEFVAAFDRVKNIDVSLKPLIEGYHSDFMKIYTPLLAEQSKFKNLAKEYLK